MDKDTFVQILSLAGQGLLLACMGVVFCVLMFL